MFHKLCRITWSSSAHRTKSVSAMGHELFVAMSSIMLDRRWQNFFDLVILEQGATRQSMLQNRDEYN